MGPVRPCSLFLARVTLIKPLQSPQAVLAGQTFNRAAWLLGLTEGNSFILLFPGLNSIILKSTKEQQCCICSPSERKESSSQVSTVPRPSVEFIFSPIDLNGGSTSASSFYSWGNQGAEMLRGLTKVTQQGSGRVENNLFCWCIRCCV